MTDTRNEVATRMMVIAEMLSMDGIPCNNTTARALVMLSCEVFNENGFSYKEIASMLEAYAKVIEGSTCR